MKAMSDWSDLQTAMMLAIAFVFLAIAAPVVLVLRLCEEWRR